MTGESEREAEPGDRTTETSDVPGNRTRRGLLRAGVASLATGLGAGAGSAAATSIRCPRSVEYWRTHPGEWPSFSEEVCLLLLDEAGGELLVHPAEDRDRLVAELETSPKDDCYLELAHQYLAARLNRRYVRPYPPGYGDFWDWVQRYNEWARRADRPQREWTVDGVDGAAIRGYFARWNAGVGGDCQRESPLGPGFRIRRV